ncbi:acetyl esterase/lipase [Rhodanobacter sp. ANJX3]|uniref:alpha/beta hydrolase n=1 Tax=Rhodanobacter sp. ANJX3 TaxID=2723083 RepID=UPI001610F30F|nr:alpha/beta hydrolase [Rhodanobacter sp. ANJX3]MBB5360484.1 acetyl esterase/lipase [Rhodanobacter sp. ANJX3]
MKRWMIAACLLALGPSVHANTTVWQPSAGHTQIPIWPKATPDGQPAPGPETVSVTPAETYAAITNVTRPTMTVYAPQGRNTGAAVVVIPGGGFQILAIDLEGTEVCDWLTSRGITCVLLKYRVPSVPYVWQCDCRPHNLTTSVPSLQDTQRTLRLVRTHAAEWHIDPHKVGVLGFSAGGYLVAEASTRFKHDLYKPMDATDRESSRPDFAIAIYPGHLTTDGGKLNKNVPVSHDTPPTFLAQAEDDDVDGVQQSLVYYAALKKAGVPVEMHLYANGGHAFGLRPSKFPISGWPALVEVWLRTIGMVRS